MNRRRNKLRHVRLPRPLARAFARLKALRLPRLRKTNRRKGRLFDRPVPNDAAVTDTDTPTQSRPVWGRTRMALAWLAPVVIAVIAFSIPTFGVKAVNYVRESRHFQVKEVVVEGHRRLSAEDLIALAGIEPGMSVLEADMESLAEPIRAHPWIRWSKIEKRLPHTVVIQVIERTASAYLVTGKLWLVDETGEIFDEADVNETTELPVISGPTEDEIATAMADPSSRALLQGQLQAALNLARTWTLASLSQRYPLGEIRIDAVRGFVVVAGGAGAEQPVEVVFGREPFREKIQRLEFTLEALRATGRHAEYVLLDVVDDVLGSDLGRESTAIADLRGARVVVKTEPVPDEDPADAIGAGGPSAEVFVGPPAPAPAPAPARRNRRRSAPAVAPQAEEDPTDIIEAVPLSGGRPADISAGMEE